MKWYNNIREFHNKNGNSDCYVFIDTTGYIRTGFEESQEKEYIAAAPLNHDQYSHMNLFCDLPGVKYPEFFSVEPWVVRRAKSIGINSLRVDNFINEQVMWLEEDNYNEYISLADAIKHLDESLNDEKRDWGDDCKRKHEQLRSWLMELRERRNKDK